MESLYSKLSNGMRDDPEAHRELGEKCITIFLKISPKIKSIFPLVQVEIIANAIYH